MNLWLVFQWRGDAMGWPEFQGVFDTEAAALAACRTDQYCVCPAVLNKEIPDEPTVWAGAYYPAEMEPEK